MNRLLQRPGIACLTFLALHALLWSLQPILTAPNIRLDTAELTVMGREWAWSYHNHPPLPAILADVIHLIVGPAHAATALAFACQVLVVAAFWLVWRLARSILAPTEALLALVPLGASGYYTWVTREWNHALVLLPLVALAVLACHRALQTGRLPYWLLLGVSLGVGLLCKYSMGLLAISIALFILLDPRARMTLRSAGPYLAALVALLIVTPHITWLVRHDFQTLQYIARRSSTAGSHGFSVQLLAFMAGQLAYLGLALAGWLLALSRPAQRRALTAEERTIRNLLIAVTIGPPALLIVFSLLTGRPLITAWAMPFWLFAGVILLFSFKPSQQPRRALLCCTVLIGINFLVALLADTVWPCMRARPSRGHFPGATLARHIEAQWRARFGIALPAVAGERWVADNVAFYATSRPRALTYDRDLIGYSAEVREGAFERGGVLVWDAHAYGAEVPEFLRREFGGAELSATIELPWQTWCELPPARIGLALIAPVTSPSSQ